MRGEWYCVRNTEFGKEAKLLRTFGYHSILVTYFMQQQSKERIFPLLLQVIESLLGMKAEFLVAFTEVNSTQYLKRFGGYRHSFYLFYLFYFIHFWSYSYSTFINIHSPRPLFISSIFIACCSEGKTSLERRAEIQTRACHTADQRTTNWVTLKAVSETTNRWIESVNRDRESVATLIFLGIHVRISKSTITFEFRTISVSPLIFLQR